MEPSTPRSIRIDIKHLTRVEGHANILVNVATGVIEQCDLQIVEAPRFFESMMCGQDYTRVASIASRICGICSVTHSVSSLRAVEKAVGVDVSVQTRQLRNLMLVAEILDSHLLHIYMLVAPDLMGVGSVLGLAQKSPEIVSRALRMKKLAGDICAVLAGRHTHPIAMVVGGFSHFPAPGEIQQARDRLENLWTDVEATIETFQKLAVPEFEQETEYLALRAEDGYLFGEDLVASSSGGRWPVEDYREFTPEYQVAHSSAKHTCHQGRPFMVGALARYNLNHDLLSPRAKAAAEALGVSPGCANPYMITWAQIVEVVQSVEEAIRITDRLLSAGVHPEEPAAPTRMSGEGVGACEAPRGTLYHHYVIENGTLAGANCVIPTAQNLANIEKDMRSLVPTILERPQEEIGAALETLVRSYDPCISCSTHMLEVKFV